MSDTLGGELFPVADLSQFNLSVSSLSWSPEGEMIAVACFSEGIYIVNTQGEIVTHLLEGTITSVDWQ